MKFVLFSFVYERALLLLFLLFYCSLNLHIPVVYVTFETLLKKKKILTELFLSAKQNHIKIGTNNICETHLFNYVLMIQE